MKTKTWILIFSVLAALCLALSVLIFYGGDEKSTALVYSDGALIRRIDLREDGEYLIEFGEQWNLLRVSNGMLCVSDASCASHDCINSGARNHGAPIVCLPNRLVIEFENAQLDAVLR